jgi:hypothetical protein
LVIHHSPLSPRRAADPTKNAPPSQRRSWSYDSNRGVVNVGSDSVRDRIVNAKTPVANGQAAVPRRRDAAGRGTFVVVTNAGLDSSSADE